MTLQQLKKYYCEVFYLEESMILDILVAIAIATKLDCDPIWLLIIGGPSSGKSELVNTLDKIPFVHAVSSMSENTFLSNMRSTNGKETSLLHRVGKSGMITMKDYTSILSMRKEKREVIVGQMREIYDGRITKEAGNGFSQEWKGKINWVGAVTDSVYMVESESAGMGRRTINYIMPKQDRKATTKRAQQNNKDIAEKREKIKDMFAQFVMDNVAKMATELPEITDELTDELINLADFTTQVRTPTERNFRGELVLVPDAEMPMRTFQMFYTLAKVLAYLNGGTLGDDHKASLYKLALDSIPKQRLIALRVLAAHQKVTTKGAAQFVNYPTDTMLVWLQDLNVLGVCERRGEQNSDVWTMKDEFRNIMTKYGHVQYVDDILVDESQETSSSMRINPTWAAGIDDKGVLKENEQKVKQMFDSF